MSLCVDKTGQAVDVSPISGTGYWSQIMRCSGRVGKEHGVPELYRNGVAMLILYEDSGLTLEEIGQAFGIHKGRVLRKIRQTRRALGRVLNGSSDGTAISERLREARLSKGRSYTEMTDDEWDAVESFMPAWRALERHMPRDHRPPLNGLLWRLETCRQWRDLPPQYTNEWTVKRLYRDLRQSGDWDQVRDALPERDL